MHITLMFTSDELAKADITKLQSLYTLKVRILRGYLNPHNNNIYGEKLR